MLPTPEFSNRDGIFEKTYRSRSYSSRHLPVFWSASKFQSSKSPFHVRYGYAYLFAFLDSAASSLLTVTDSDNVADPFLCPRNDTVQELARILDDERVAHVRGTPASGKTTLAYLLHEHYRQQNIPSVIISDWPQGNDHVHTDVLIRRAQDAGYTFVTADTLRNADIVYIIDEGQMSYHDSGLWLGFIKSQNNRRFGPRVCVFTSYGSPTGGPNDYSAGSPLAYLGVQQRVSITVSKIKDSPPISLFYNRNEFDDVLQRICTDSRRPLPLHPDAADYIFSLTNGHPGAVDSVLGMIQKVSPDVYFCPSSLIAYGMRCRFIGQKLNMGRFRWLKRIILLQP